MKTIQNTGVVSPLFRGLVTTFIFLFAASIIVSLLVLWTEMKEQSLAFYAYLIHGLSIFAGGLASGRKADKKGWYHGAVLGIVYSLLILAIAHFGFDSTLGLNALSLILLSLMLGALGGAIGVNVKK
ncbi:TIGR04086 family membrane protein [Ferviditalea candida]|uniref:TIGR04086 family membrane protein n=1 Tax=Ferviditalea candida TaxID=3108399 RepID=A0ABU5ZII2_9BACL|nr:TIGR04086 family membrane protein [Paenibacillaceae bacterium T2]